MLLRELQKAFAGAVYENTPDVLVAVRDGAFPAARHLQVYRNNTYTNLTEALATIHPVVQRLVGDEFFAHAASSYISAHPPRSGNLHDFGGMFASFLGGFAPARSLTYLPDVARLEWFWHESFHAADAPPFPLEKLAAVPANQYGALRFTLHPSARLLTSIYPILRIWEVNQPGFDTDPSVNLDQGGDELLIVRRELTVEIERIAPSDYALLNAFATAAPLATANQTAISMNSDFDLMQTLRRYIQSATIIGFTIDNSQ